MLEPYYAFALPSLALKPSRPLFPDDRCDALRSASKIFVSEHYGPIEAIPLLCARPRGHCHPGDFLHTHEVSRNRRQAIPRWCVAFIPMGVSRELVSHKVWSGRCASKARFALLLVALTVTLIWTNSQVFRQAARRCTAGRSGRRTRSRGGGIH